MMGHYILLALSVILIFALGLMLRFLYVSPAHRSRERPARGRGGRPRRAAPAPRGSAAGPAAPGAATGSAAAGPGAPRNCPLCAAALAPGELVQSRIFTAPGGPEAGAAGDRIMHIFGCVHCLGGKARRLCPVCGAALKDEEVVYARLFDRPGRRPHVHVVGCPRCRGR